MDGYVDATYLTEGLEISELKDDGYHEVRCQSDVVYISSVALKDLWEAFNEIVGYEEAESMLRTSFARRSGQ